MQAKDILWVDFLTLINKQQQEGEKPRFAYRTLCNKYPEKVVYAKFQKALNKDYIDYGTSILSPWLTEKGIETLIGLGGNYTPPEPFSLPKMVEMMMSLTGWR